MNQVFLQTKDGQAHGPMSPKIASDTLRKDSKRYHPLVCVEGTEAWLPADIILHKGNRLYLMISIAASAFALGALVLAVGSFSELRKYRGDAGAKEPKMLVESMFDRMTDGLALQAEQAFKIKNRSEILKTLEIAEVVQDGDYAVAFVRYSVGSDVFRNSFWLARVGDKWYWIGYLSNYSKQKPKNEEWFTKMEEKMKKWDDEGSTRQF